MGCGQSQLNFDQKSIYLQIIDSNFMKVEYDSVRKNMNDNNIVFETFMTIDYYLEQLMKKYVNLVVVTANKYSLLKKYLQNMKLQPQIYIIGQVLDSKKNLKIPSEEIVFENYDILIDYLLRKEKKVSVITNDNKSSVPLKFLWNGCKSSSEQIIFQQTFKNKKIHFEEYFDFQSFKKSLLETCADFIVTDYIYHQQVIGCVNKKAKVICFCELNQEESYNQQIFFFSNNLLQIINQIQSQISLRNFLNVKCQKVYLYSPEYSQLQTYKSVITSFDFSLVEATDLNSLITLTKFQFCVTLLVHQKHKKNVQKFISSNLCDQRFKIITFPENIQPFPHKMHKIIKELKKGYKASYGITKSVDIIDKHCNDTKYDEIKKQFDFNHIRISEFQNLNTYIKTTKFYSPFIICNYEQRNSLSRHLKQIKQKSKIIIFCNKNKINSQLRSNENFNYVNCHCSKIIKYIKKNKVYIPYIINEQQKNIKLKKQKIIDRNHRISALNWSGLQLLSKNNNSQNNDNNDNNNFTFININENTSNLDIKEIKKQNGSFWKLSTNPIQQFVQFKEELIISLRQLKKIYNIQYPIDAFNSLLKGLQKLHFDKLMLKIRQFFSSSNQMGLKINQALVDVTQMQPNQIKHLKEILFCINLNFLSIYNLPRSGCIRLQHWTNQKLLGVCQKGSKLLNKNYMIFYENTNDLEGVGSKKIQTTINYNSIMRDNIHINQFFKHQNKYIFSPYCEFIIKGITKLGDTQLYQLQLQNDVDFLQNFYQYNLYQCQNQHTILQKQLENTNSVMFEQKEQVNRNYQRYRAIQLYHKKQYDLAIEMHKQTIQKEEENQNLDNAKINQMYYELICMYNKKGDYTNTLNNIKQLFEAKPGLFIQQQCKKILQVYKEAQINQQTEQQNQFKFKINSQTLKSFTWLTENVNNSSSDQSETKQKQEKTNKNLCSIQNFGFQIKQSCNNLQLTDKKIIRSKRSAFERQESTNKENRMIQ